MKCCNRCFEIKSCAEFYRHSAMSDGLLNKCKQCAKSDVSKNYRKNRHHYADYEKERFKNPARKAFHAQAQRDHRLNNPEKSRARSAINYHVRSGKIQKLPCKCGSEKVQAHHHDYLKPLDVKWMCRSCHLKSHNKKAYD